MVTQIVPRVSTNNLRRHTTTRTLNKENEIEIRTAADACQFHTEMRLLITQISKINSS